MSKTAAPADGAHDNQGDADDDHNVPSFVTTILTEQSIPENSGSQTQVFMFEHFWVGARFLREKIRAVDPGTFQEYM